MKRNTFLQTLTASSAALVLGPSRTSSNQQNGVFDKEQIRDFVFAAHADLEQTQKIVEASPLILNCTNQGKRGDFETAIGGAAHMGRRDIADMLVERGARLDIFSMAFLGHLEAVKAILQVSPNFIQAPGPHGFTLLHHAIVGKHEEFADWLREQGLKTEFFKGVFG